MTIDCSRTVNLTSPAVNYNIALTLFYVIKWLNKQMTICVFEEQIESTFQSRKRLCWQWISADGWRLIWFNYHFQYKFALTVYLKEPVSLNIMKQIKHTRLSELLTVADGPCKPVVFKKKSWACTWKSPFVLCVRVNGVEIFCLECSSVVCFILSVRWYFICYIPLPNN